MGGVSWAAHNELEDKNKRKKFAQMIQNINIMSLKKDMKKEKEKFKFSKNIKKKKKMIFKGKNRLLLKI